MSRRSRVRPARLALLAVLVAALVVPVATAQPSGSEDAGFEDGQTVFVVELDASGDADWQVSERLDIADDADAAGFDELAGEFERGEVKLGSVSVFETVVEAVDARTTRSMSMGPVSRTTSVDEQDGEQTGVLTASFTWENFARISEANATRLHVDDAFVTESGRWLSGLGADQELQIRPPEGYGVLDASVPVQDGALRWAGPVEFGTDTLEATFVGDTTPGGDPPDDTAGDDSTSDDGEDGQESGLGLLSVVLGGGVVVLGAALLVLYWERDRWLDRDPDQTPAAGDPSPGASADETAPETEPAVADGAAVDDTTTTGAGDSSAERENGLDEELLSDEERVERLIEANGGRMKQADIVDETGWSNAKVSQLLSSMAEEDRIDKLRIGRENLISFPDIDVTDIENDE